eukprot:5829071-Prymnesium_polylepis.1
MAHHREDALGVGMRREGRLRHLAANRHLAAARVHHDLALALEQRVAERVWHAVARDEHEVGRIAPPLAEGLERHASGEHPRRREQHARPGRLEHRLVGEGQHTLKFEWVARRRRRLLLHVRRRPRRKQPKVE